MVSRIGFIAIVLAIPTIAGCAAASANNSAGGFAVSPIPAASTDDERWQNAFHQAGHAVAHLQLGLTFDRATIEASADRAGVRPDFSTSTLIPPGSVEEAIAWRRAERWSIEDQARARQEIRALAAGPLAQMRFEGIPLERQEREFLQGGSQDAASVRGYAWGFSAYLTSGSHSEQLQRIYVLSLGAKRSSSILRQTQGLVERDWPAIERLAGQLMASGSLSYAEVRELVWPLVVIRH